MKYIVHRRFKHKAICGDVNIPAMSECELIDGFIYYNGKPVCTDTSRSGHMHFARNDDGNGMLRGKLTQAIQKILETDDDEHQARWDKVWDDETCQKYKRTEHADVWLWNHEFYNGPIDDLQYIATLVGVTDPALTAPASDSEESED